MKKISVKSFIAGIIITIIVATMINTVFAAQLSETITAVYKDIKITIDGKQIDPKDANGNIVEPFILDGTTYLPVRAIADAVGYDVVWDSSTNTVKLTKKADAIKTTDLEYSWEKYYKSDDYNKYITSASQNKLDGTLLKISGTIDKIEMLADNQVACFTNDKNKEKWLFIYVKEYFDKLNLKKGDTVTAYGVYTGVSMAYDNTPAILLFRLKSGNILYNGQVNGIDIGVVYEGRSFGDIHAEMQNNKTAEPTTTPETTVPTTAAPTTTEKPTQQPTTTAISTTEKITQSTTNAPYSSTVYITDTGKKFHREGCKSLSKSSHAISRSEAVSKGYTACDICKP